MDGRARQERGAHHRDEKHHLAKVRVAGSNPDFRSKMGLDPFDPFRSKGARFIASERTELFQLKPSGAMD